MVSSQASNSERIMQIEGDHEHPAMEERTFSMAIMEPERQRLDPRVAREPGTFFEQSRWAPYDQRDSPVRVCLEVRDSVFASEMLEVRL